MPRETFAFTEGVLSGSVPDCKQSPNTLYPSTSNPSSNCSLKPNKPQHRRSLVIPRFPMIAIVRDLALKPSRLHSRPWNPHHVPSAFPNEVRVSELLKLLKLFLCLIYSCLLSYALSPFHMCVFYLQPKM